MFAIATVCRNREGKTRADTVRTSMILGILIVGLSWAPKVSAAPLIGDPFPVAADPVHQLAPAVAHAPARHAFLVVWQTVGGDGGGAGEISGGPIHARVVTEEGGLGPIVFVGDGMTPDVAYNGAADQFLVVWSTTPDMEIHGRRLNGDGEPMGEAFPISGGRPDSELRPAVAFNGHPQYGDYLVVWEDGVDDLTGSMTRWGIWAQRVSGTGSGEPLIGMPIEVIDSGPGGAQDRDPDVAYNLNRNEYLVAYTHYPSGAFGTPSDVHARPVTADGELLPERVVVDDDEAQFAPAVAAYPPNAMAPYLVVYGDFSTSLQGDVRGRLLNGNGQPVKVLDIATAGDRPEDGPAVAASESLGGYTVLWSELELDDAIWGRRVRDTGEMEPRFPVSPFDGSPSGTNQQAPAVAGGLPLALAVWEDIGTWMTGTTDISGRFLGYRLEGRVFVGEVGDDTTPLAGARVELFCSDNGDPDVPVGEAVTDPEGAYGLVATADCAFYDVVETDPDGYTSTGALSVGGNVVEPNRIRYAAPLEGKELRGNDFWDVSVTTPEPTASATPTATATGLQTPPTNAPTPTPTAGTATASPSPTTTGTPGALIVDTTDDTDDGSCDASHCSLREAINAANVRAGADSIRFAIPSTDTGCDGSGVCTIQPIFVFPELNDDGTTVDGFTQAGAAPNASTFGDAIDAALKIVLDGSSLPCCAVGVSIRSSSNTVRGLVIDGFYTGIEVLDGDDNRIEGNFIGTDVEGKSSEGNACSGIILSALSMGPGSSNNVVGGSLPQARNLVSGNGCGGIEIGPGENNAVHGNYVGTDLTGTMALPNTADGIRVFNASRGQAIGGTGSGEANLIAFNGQNGVEIDGSVGGAVRNSIRRNRIHSNTNEGIQLTAGANEGIIGPAIDTASATRLTGSACAGCIVEIFSDAGDEGAIYEGTATAGGSGNWTFDKAAGLTGPNVTATATDSQGNTSEFSAPVSLLPASPSATTTASATPTQSGTPTVTPPTPRSCIGDCDGNGLVSVAELIRGINIALGIAVLADCRSFDSDGDGSVDVAELVAAVSDSLTECAQVSWQRGAEERRHSQEKLEDSRERALVVRRAIIVSANVFHDSDILLRSSSARRSSFHLDAQGRRPSRRRGVPVPGTLGGKGARLSYDRGATQSSQRLTRRAR